MGLLYRDGNAMVVVGAGDFFINIWREGASLARLARLRDAELRFADSVRGRLIVFTVMEATSFEHIMNAAEREAAAHIARDVAPLTRAAALVFEGTGFRQAIARAAIAGINLIARPKHPNKAFSQVAEAATWVHTTCAIDADALIREVATTRGLLDV